MKPSDEVVSAIYYQNDRFVVTSTHAIKGIEKLGNTNNKKIVIAHNFTDEAIEILKINEFNLIQSSNFPWTDDRWKKSNL
ncbi:hypothetical protein [Bacillus sp. AFS053548]|uniref:hypothetical protein n=1 Tax=Bacillus sp. AFS053548 TaxID=2033505 RepID=UPI000BFB9709|nr:hypothetical protein [Bacillus sp. AFS053548]PGM53836.1 hypothetical protein CN946_16595 [Bacillus sp. AFS053548]